MRKVVVTLTLLAGGLLQHASLAEQSGRPQDLTLAEFQFGPFNRWTFSHMREVLPTVNIPRDSERMLPLRKSKQYVADFAVDFQGRRQGIDEIATHQYIDGLLVLKDGKVVFEKYFGQLTAERPHLMNSVSKSMVALVAGKLAGDGIIDLDKPVSHYVPQLAASGWGPDSLQTVLDMRDGSDYTEDYEDFGTTFRIQDCAVGWTDADYCPADGPRGGYAFFPTVGRNEANLGSFHYRSGSTDAIGWVLEAATGRPLAELISTYLWKPIGAEFDANITVDESGFVLADHGMSSTLRDLGRVGLLMLNRGKAFGKQVVPAAFIDDIIGHAADPHWPYPPYGDYEPYYRSFWWGEGNVGNDVSGVGIHGQYVRVAPADNIVITMYSTWPRADGDGKTHGWDPSAELLEAILDRFR